jgi:Spy/CpxP family protein refolding chaperone
VQRAAIVIAAARQRARRAFRRLSLTEAQAVAARRLLKDDRLQLEAARGLLAECRRQLREVLAAPVPDSAIVLELTVEERLLEEKERAASGRLERSLAALLRPEQVTRLRGLAPAAVGDMLGRICG